MVFNFQNQEVADLNRRTTVRRSLTAYMAYHSGYLQEYGLGAHYVDTRSIQAIHEYVEIENISHDRAMSCTSFNHYFSHIGIEAICMDHHVLERAIHLPPVGSSDTANFPAPLTVQIGQAGAPGSEVVTFTDYADFHQAYRRLSFCIAHYPEIVLDDIKFEMWTTFGPRINSDMRLRLEGEAFVPPEVRMTGINETMTINEVLCSQHHDGRLVQVVGQVLEMGDARKRAIRIAWKCQAPTCGMLTYRIVDPFEDAETKPKECHYCQAGTTADSPKAEFVQDGAPNTTFITFQRLMIRQTDTQMTTPPQLLVEVRGSHVHAMNQGEDVAITGIFRTIVDKSGGKNERLPLLYGTDLTRTSQDSVVEVTDGERHLLAEWKEQNGFDSVMQSLTNATASHVIGHTREKQAILLQAVGSYRNLPDGKRPFVHIMFIGDPGTAKSQLLGFAVDAIHPGSKIATGARSSIAGLVGGKSENQRLLGSSTTTLSPGMLALIPPGGIAGIDELHALGDKNVFTALNDAMETGRVSVQMQMKGTIRTPTPVLGCSNPKGGDNTRFDLYSGTPLMEQAGLPTAFVSRFDLIFVFLDIVDEGKDKSVFGGMTRSMNRSTNDPNAAFPIPDGYRKYLQMCREVTPAEQIFSDATTEHMEKIFVAARQNRVGGATVNFRWGAALLRLSCAVARLDLSQTVEIRHVDFAHEILAESLTTKEPNMVQEAGTGLGVTQTKVMEEIQRLLTDWATIELGERDYGPKKDAYAYVAKHWGLDAADYPCPNERDFDSFISTLKAQNIVESKGSNIGIKGL